MEERQLLAAAPLFVGAVYIEDDFGSDDLGDTFVITFEGGAPGTQLTRVEIDGDKSPFGLSRGDMIFDTELGGLGADGAFPFRLVSLLTQDPTATVRETVEDGGSLLALEFTNFYAGDKLIFSIDVDEVLEYDPDATDLEVINQWIDPIASGLEFQGSMLRARFSAPYYHPSQTTAMFWSLYDERTENTGLDLPSENIDGRRNRTAGAVGQLQQVPLPVELSGTVYLETNLDLIRQPDEPGLGGVELALYRQVGGTYQPTGHRTVTDAKGFYRFGLELDLRPGVYQVRQMPPDDLFTVGAIPGTIDGKRVGSASEDHRLLSGIALEKGDQRGRDYDFALARPAELQGYVYHDRNNDGRRDAGEEGIASVAIQLVPLQTLTPAQTVTVTTDATGSFRATGLAPGTYRVVQPHQPEGYFDGLDAAGTVSNVVRGVAQNPGDSIEGVFLGGGEKGRDYVFGELLPAMLSGQVRLADAGGDCFSEASGQRPLPGARVELLDAAGRLVSATETDSQGTYRFGDLWPGRYSVVQTTPEGLINGRSHVGRIGGVPVGRALEDSLVDIVIGSGQMGTDYDFCEFEPASLAGRVYHDRNNNGWMEPGEGGIPDVRLVLLDAQGSQVAGTVTDPSGDYVFDGLHAGQYTIVQVHPEGWVDGWDRAGTVEGIPQGAAINPGDRMEGIQLRWGEAGVDYLFGEFRYASLEGYVRLTSPEGICQPPGPSMRPLVSVPLWLMDPHGQIVAETRTDTTGHYRFEGLLPGEYQIFQPTPDGLLDGPKQVGTIDGVAVGRVVGDAIVEISVASDQTGVDYNFCEYEPASLAGWVYHDQNNNGVRDPGEAPIAGVTIRLLDQSGRVISSTTTAPDGSYRFAMLQAGGYTLNQVQPEGYLDGLDTAGTVDGKRVGVAVHPGDEIHSIHLRWGDQGLDYNFGELLPGSLTGRVHADNNGNGRFDVGEWWLEDVVMHLVDPHGNDIASTRTDHQGVYRFDGLVPGIYHVIQTQPEGYFQGGQRAGSAGGDGSIDDRISKIPVGSGQHLVNYDFWDIPPSTLSGMVFADRNQNDRWDASELTLAGVTMHLVDTGGVRIATTTTDASGRYRFEHLPPGTYRVQQEQPAGYFDGAQRAGSHGGNARLSNQISAIHVPAGQTLTRYDFWEIPPGVLSGYVFQDGPALVTFDGRLPENARELRRGELKPTDQRIPGVVLELREVSTGQAILGNSSSVLPGRYGAGPITAVTDAQGFYAFEGLMPGIYAVRQIQPKGYYDGIDTPGPLSAELYDGRVDLAALAPWIVADPSADADVLLVVVPADVASEDNNFSELAVQRRVIVWDPPSSDPPPPVFFVDTPAPPPAAPPLIVAPLTSPPWEFAQGSGGLPPFSWHLSIIDAGNPRGNISPLSTDNLVLHHVAFSPSEDWLSIQVADGHWTLRIRGDQGRQTLEDTQREMFGMPGAVPVVGDFNGDGVDNVGIYYRGHWLLDMNGNGRWDEEDLWVLLGDDQDLPVIGDWNGDGKGDVGIFGPAWAGDHRALQVAAGLPDLKNRTIPVNKPKNVPPDVENATCGLRLLQATIRGQIRADVIDHVFRYGGGAHVPVSGDFTGDGITNIGVFKDGRWWLDTDGNGRWSEGDLEFIYGQAGDIPIVGDFNGDGLADVGVYRAGLWILDQNGNRVVDDQDHTFRFGTAQDIPVVGDFNGDGIDEPAIAAPRATGGG
jgi:serine-aspartate repeat-containing protein C/D/E